jgi:hypothetical protein
MVGAGSAIGGLAWWRTTQQELPVPAQVIDHVQAPVAVRIEVLNGCGRPGAARKVAQLLRAKGFDVINGNGENADSFRYLETVVVDRTGDLEKARIVADAIGVDSFVQQVRSGNYGIEEVSVVVGWDLGGRPEGYDIIGGR